MIRLSIIVPTYNRRELLCETVDSILHAMKISNRFQLEIIIVDDKSIDGTLSFINKKYQNLIFEKTWFIVKLDANLGVTAARNAGANVANGNWLVFIDSDDLLVSDGLKIIYKEILKRGWVDAIFFSCVDFNGNFIGTKFSSQKLSLKSYEKNGTYGEKIMVIKKDIFMQNQYDEDLRGFEGLTYFRMLAKGYDLWISSNVIRKYRVDSIGSLSRKKSILNRADKLALGYNRLILEYHKIYSRAPFVLHCKAKIYKFLAYLWLRK